MEQYQLVWPQEASPLARRGLLLLVEVSPAEAETADSCCTPGECTCCASCTCGCQ